MSGATHPCPPFSPLQPSLGGAGELWIRWVAPGEVYSLLAFRGSFLICDDAFRFWELSQK